MSAETKRLQQMLRPLLSAEEFAGFLPEPEVTAEEISDRDEALASARLWTMNVTHVRRLLESKPEHRAALLSYANAMRQEFNTLAKRVEAGEFKRKFKVGDRVVVRATGQVGTIIGVPEGEEEEESPRKETAH